MQGVLDVIDLTWDVKQQKLVGEKSVLNVVDLTLDDDSAPKSSASKKRSHSDEYENVDDEDQTNTMMHEEHNPKVRKQRKYS